MSLPFTVIGALQFFTDDEDDDDTVYWKQWSQPTITLQWFRLSNRRQFSRSWKSRAIQSLRLRIVISMSSHVVIVVVRQQTPPVTVRCSVVIVTVVMVTVVMATVVSFRLRPVVLRRRLFIFRLLALSSLKFSQRNRQPVFELQSMLFYLYY